VQAVVKKVVITCSRRKRAHHSKGGNINLPGLKFRLRKTEENGGRGGGEKKGLLEAPAKRDVGKIKKRISPTTRYEGGGEAAM